MSKIIEVIDPRLLGKSEEIRKEELRKNKEVRAVKEYNNNSTEQFVYTVPQLKKVMPGISIVRIRELIEEGKIRTIPAGVFDARWEVIPKVTLEEDLKKIVEKYN